MKTGLPSSFASENGVPANDVPLIATAANGWKPAGGTTTCELSMCATSSCLVSPKTNTPPSATSATTPATSLRLMAAPYRVAAERIAPRGPSLCSAAC